MPLRKREKANSITHLVKIVAREVFDAEIRKIPHRPTPEEFLQSIKNDCEQAGQKWSKAEDQMLIDEVRVAIAAIARNHQRTTGAIFSRVRDQSIINCDSIR